MSRILISINPTFVDEIISGEKRFEYRTKVAKRGVTQLIIYCTFPTMKVLAEADVDGVIALPPAELWEKTKGQSGITKEFFDSYFKGRKIAYAYRLGKVTKYENGKPLSAFGCSYAPQSFIYLT